MAVAVKRWQTAPAFPAVSADRVDLWRFRLDLSASQSEGLKAFLSADEIARAERLRILEKRQQIIVAHAKLRQILGKYLSCDPRLIAFDYAEQGKPGLVDADGIHFNLSHSGCWGMLVVSTAEVGIDIEKIDPAIDFRLLAKRYFSLEERAVLESSSDVRQIRTFYRFWTAKESVLKQNGRGFTAVTQISAQNGQSHHFHVAKNYVAAVASSFAVASINKFDFV